MADRRHVDDLGVQWASRYESEVFAELGGLLGGRVRKCEQGTGDTVPYTSTITGGRCLECESGSVVQRRTYTPDLFVDTSQSGDGCSGYFVEAKGFWNAHKRNLLRSVARSNPDLDLVLVFQRDGWVTKGKSKYSDYVRRYLPRCACVIWNNRLKNPGDLAEMIEEARRELEEG